MEYKSFNYLLDLAPLTAQENIQVNRLYKDIENYMVEALTSFITRGVTDQSWESFINGLDGLGVYEYVALYQDAYNRYLKIIK